MRPLKSSFNSGNGIIAGITDRGLPMAAVFFVGDESVLSAQDDGVYHETTSSFRCLSFGNGFISACTAEARELLRMPLTAPSVAEDAFFEVLSHREFLYEPPYFPPRLNALLLPNGDICLAVIRADNALPPKCKRDFYRVQNLQKGTGRIVFSYDVDENSLTTFKKPPINVRIKGTANEFASELKKSLYSKQDVCLAVCFACDDGSYETVVIT